MDYLGVYSPTAKIVNKYLEDTYKSHGTAEKGLKVIRDFLKRQIGVKLDI